MKGAILLIDLCGNGPLWKCPRIWPSRKGRNRLPCLRVYETTTTKAFLMGTYF
jgi:hypothetical protein